MKNISITVENKRATVVGSPVIVCGNSDYAVTFAFDDEWSLTGPKTARFVYVKRGKVEHEDKVFEGNTVAVPVLSDVAFVNVGVFAGDLCTTTPAQVRCRASILCGSGTVHEPTPDVYSQIMSLFEEMAEKGAFGATEEQARQIEQNRQNIEQQGQEIEQHGQEIEQHGQSIEQHGQDIEDVTDRVEKLEDGTMPAGDANKLGGHEADYFFPRSGGIIDGSISVKSEEAINIYSYIRNAVRNVFQYINANGYYTLYDDTNKKVIIESKADGTNTFNGTASGNLPLKGGQIDSATYEPLKLNSTLETAGAVYVAFKINGVNLGQLGVTKYGEPIFYATDGSGGKKLLHDGNSAKVHVGTGAPSDKSSVWFDTSEL